ncbi:hypothetical protein R1flu_015510 [Riccia fluitans]|uniref:Replitron HUH endonuclease domain-containing protein n=1 Tax=Riccia fluitans TaxID=41844 RepID=A0ABD1YK78_9MARC
MKAAKKRRRVPEKSFDINLTIGIPDKSVDDNVFNLLVKWLEYRAEMAVLALERGDAFFQLHVQGMLKVKTNSTKILKREIKEVIGWESNGPIGGSICLKSLHFVEVPDVETIFFGVETPTRYFEIQEGKTTAQDEDARQDCQSGLADDEEASTILIVELDKALDIGADVDRLHEVLLEAGFAVGMKTAVKEENPMDHIPVYFRLWD